MKIARFLGLALLISLIWGILFINDTGKQIILQNMEDQNYRIHTSAEEHSVLWNETWGGSAADQCNGIALDPAGNLYCAGSTTSFGAGSTDFALVKLYPNGTRAWNTTWGGPAGELCYGVALDPAGNIYCAGAAASWLTTSDFALVKFYSNGTLAWNTTWGDTMGGDICYQVALDPAGNIYCAGYIINVAADNDFALVKFYSNGTLAWDTTWGDSGNDEYRGVTLDSAGNIYCVGGLDLGGNSFDFAIVKYYPDGARAWVTTWGGPSSEKCYGVALDPAGNLYCAGSTNSWVLSVDFALVKIYSNGTLAWNTTWGGSDFDRYFGIALGPLGDLFCDGYTRSFGAGDYDFAVVKVKNSKPPTYTSITENADPLVLGGTETILINVASIFGGINLVWIEFEGRNHTMIDLGGGTWGYIAWTPSRVGIHPYTIYIQDVVGNWNEATGSIEVTNTPTPDLEPIVWILSFVIIGIASLTVALYLGMNRKIKKLSISPVPR